MAVVYFTSNASTGAESLAEAVANAQPGDVIRPDESVFERGSTIEIVLASALNVDKDLTLDASPFRVRLDGGGTKRCVSVASGVSATFTAFDFVDGRCDENGGCVLALGALTLNNCGVYGGSASLGGGVSVEGMATLNDCVVTGCRATQFGGGLTALNGATLNGVSIVGNVAGQVEQADARIVDGVLTARNSIIGKAYAPSGVDVSGCVVDVASSQIGFVASPPDDLTLDNWTSELWRSWDLRLLDDASPNPSPYRDSGDVGSMSRYDLQGNFRGRETNGVAMCSPGAYETIQADLFWVGVDANGAEVVSPSFLASDGWAASRFATVADNVAPVTGNAVFVDGATTFSDMPSGRLYLTIGGFSNVVISKGGSFQARTLHVGALSVFQGSLAVSSGARIGAWARLASFFAPSGEADFDVESSADYVRYFRGLVSTIPKYDVVELQSTEGTLRVPSALECNILRIRHVINASDCRIVVDGSATFRAKTIELTNNRETPDALFTDGAQVVFALRDAAGITQSNAPGIWADEFSVDVSEATSATLTLNGQTVYGDAPTCDITLTGSAAIAERGLDVASLTLAANATLTVDGARGAVVELIVGGGATVAFSGVNATLTAAETATVGAASFTGIGYFATPPGTDTSSAAFSENVRDCDYGADVSSFNAFPVSTRVVNLSWVKKNLVPCVLIEEANGNEWNIVNNRADGESLVVDISAPETYRLFDGENFFTTSARPYGTAYELAEEQTIGYLKTLISTGYLN
jgi:hypothetical protein